MNINISPINKPPYFEKNLTQIFMNASDKFSYELPKVIDPDNDNVQTLVKFGLASEFSS
jgi:hypothetical protein